MKHGDQFRLKMSPQFKHCSRHRESHRRGFCTNLKYGIFPAEQNPLQTPPPPRTETCGVLVTDGEHTSAQQKPRQWYHRRLSALQ